MQLTTRIATVIAFLIVATSAFAADALTDSDLQYLQANGYRKTGFTMCKILADEKDQANLHDLIVDPKTSGKEKLGAVQKFMISVALDDNPIPTSCGG